MNRMNRKIPYSVAEVVEEMCFELTHHLLSDDTYYCVKIDTEAIARNGKQEKGKHRWEYDPAIMVLRVRGEDCEEILSEELFHTVEINGPVILIQDDKQPGCRSGDNRRARVWLQTKGPLACF